MLRAHVEFLASDSMHGRPCPSPYCDLAADYILAQFKGAGLETQVQTTKRLVEVRRGEVVAHPPEALLDVRRMVMEVPGTLDEAGRIKAARGISIEKTPELDPIYSANGPILVTNVPAGQRNVIGVLKGSDPVLRDEYVLVTAHYDHLGEKNEATGTAVLNGANDNASGVSALIEIARAIAVSAMKPKRSVVFIAYFGEERRMVGSRYYARNPLFPIDKTYAQVNLEQIGRTDDSEGPRVKAATITGWDRSQVGAILAAAALPLGVRFYKHEKYSEEFFTMSDNEALAKLGVPAHTLSVAYEFPDYHAAGDDADKLDYSNMALISRAVRAGVTALANRRLKLTVREVSAETSSQASGSSATGPKPSPSKPSANPPHH